MRKAPHKTWHTWQCSFVSVSRGAYMGFWAICFSLIFFFVVCLFHLTWKPTNKAPTNLKEKRKAKKFEQTYQNKNSVVINHQKVQEAPDPYWWTSNQCVQRASEQKTANGSGFISSLTEHTGVPEDIAVNSEHVWGFSVYKFYSSV